MLSRLGLFALALGCACAWSCLAISNPAFVWGAPQAETDATSAEGSESSDVEKSHGLIDFARDVRPVLSEKCLECHGPDKAKNDFRVDEAAILLSYIEPGSAADSSLWTDYLVTDDEDMKMPPATDGHNRPLTATELATIKLWIEEGGMWDLVSEDVEPATEVVPASMAQRVWQFQGLFHPATVHFPIALLTVSALFVFLSFFRPDTCEPVAFHCLWIGALGAVVASVAGWSYAVHEGYGAGFSFDLFNSAIDRHRWLGILVAVVAMILIPIAVYVRRTEDLGMRVIWLVGSLLVMAGVGLVGFQGGELTYGEGHYTKAFVRLFPEAIADSKEKSEAEGSAVEEEPKGEGADAAIVDETAEPLKDTQATNGSPDVETIEGSQPDSVASAEEPLDAEEAPPLADAAHTGSNDENTTEATSEDASSNDENMTEATSEDASSNDATIPPPVVQPPEPADASSL